MASFSVVPAPDRDGVQLANVFRALAPRWEIDAVALRSGDQAFVERFMRTRLLRVPAPSGDLREQVEAFRRALRRQLDTSDYDVIHFRSAWAGLPACERKEQLGAKLVFEVALSPEGEPRAADRALGAALREAEAFCLERADLVLVATSRARAELSRRGVRAQIGVFPAGVDVDVFDWEPAAPTRTPRIAFAGRIAPGRGVRLLLRAMRRVLERRDAALTLVGPVEPGFEEPLRQAIAELSLEGHVERVGAVAHEDVPHVLAPARVAVAPSAPDESRRPLAAAPSKILEYMACRLPVVAPRRDAVAELLRDGAEGLLFAPGDPDDLASKILRLLDDPDFAARLASAGYARARAEHTAAASRRALLEAYAHAFGPSPERRPTEPPLPVAGLPADLETTAGRAAPRERSATVRVGVVPPPEDARTRGRPWPDT